MTMLVYQRVSKYPKICKKTMGSDKLGFEKIYINDFKSA